jgi:hypothetical protein
MRTISLSELISQRDSVMNQPFSVWQHNWKMRARGAIENHLFMHQGYSWNRPVDLTDYFQTIYVTDIPWYSFWEIGRKSGALFACDPFIILAVGTRTRW